MGGAAEYPQLVHFLGRRCPLSPDLEADYRIRLAESRLQSAMASAASGRWADAAMFARGAVENGAKALLFCFRTVPRTHEPSDIVQAALADSAFPERLRHRVQELVLVCIWTNWGGGIFQLSG